MGKQKAKVALSEHPAIDALLGRVVKEVRSFAEEQVSHIQELVKIGTALSAEKDIDRLLEMIVDEARRFTHADGGTLYIRNSAGDRLDFAIVQNDSLGVRMGGTGEKIGWPSVPLQLPDGSDNHSNVSAYCALSGKAINIPDVYHAAGFDFGGTKQFDASTGYRSTSMLVIPMRNHEGEVIGVLQLLNGRDRKSGRITVFPDQEVGMVSSLASQAAIALTNASLIRGLEELLNSFVRAIASAIDEKSPYTGGHIQRVALLAEELAREVNRRREGALGSVFLSEEELAEIRMAAWMHDVGKITTPEHIVDKSTKLETIFDRIETIRLRIEILKRDAEIRMLKEQLDRASNIDCRADAHWAEESRRLEEALRFLEQVNIGGEFLGDEAIGRIKELAGWPLQVGGQECPLLEEKDVISLTTRKGTLTGAEREVINNHARVTIKMLNGLPFPKKLRYVPEYAGMHHEKLDGSGYPQGLRNGQIPLQARILAIADVLEALTAPDRPYKPGKLLSESMRILGFMVKDRHLDADLCNVLVESGLVARYALHHLAPGQRDRFQWQGRWYEVGEGAAKGSA